MSWKKVRVKDISTQIRGVSYTPNDASNNSKENYLPILRANNITDIGIVYDDLIYVDKKNISNNQLLKEGDILIAASSGSKAIVGKASMFTNNWIGSFGAFCKVVRPSENIYKKYFGYYFQSSEYRKIISHLSAGANINNIRSGDINNLEVLQPPLPTQQKIAAILDKADELRRKDKALLAQYDALLQSIFYNIFGDPVKNEKGWELEKLKNVCSKIGSGSTPRGGKESYIDAGISIIRSLNVHDNEFKYKDLAFIDNKQAYELRNVIVEEEDVLFNITGASVCRSCIVPIDVLPARVNQHVSILRAKKEILASTFLLSTLVSGSLKNKLLNIGKSAGATREAITKEQLESLEIIIPPIKLQNKFSSIAKNIESQKQQIKQQIQQSENLFQSLLQKAFKGELVKD